MHQDLFDAFCCEDRLSVESISKQLGKDLHLRVGDLHLEMASKDRKTKNTYQVFRGDFPLELPRYEARESM